MYDKKIISVTCDVTGSRHLPLSQTVTPSRTPLERDVLYGRPIYYNFHYYTESLEFKIYVLGQFSVNNISIVSVTITSIYHIL